VSRIETIGNATLHLGDSREILPSLPKVDAVVTSPPYAQQRDYGAKIEDWPSVVRCLAQTPAHDETQVLVNLGLVHQDGEVVEYWEPFKRDMRAAGWRFFGWFVWDKGFGVPCGDVNRLPLSHEWVFQFNRNSRKPNKWVRSKDRTIPGRGIRQADGSLKTVTSPVGQPYKMPDSVIRLPPHQLRGGIETEHPAIFPEPFAGHLIQTFSDRSGTVCDPFMGSGTTGVAAIKMGRKFIGIEIEPKYFDIARRRIEEAARQPDMFIERPKPSVQEVLL
jgi:DNA modification methylase